MLKKIAKKSLSIGCIYSSGFIKTAGIVGTKISFFSAFPLIAPLMGEWAGLSSVCGAMLIKIVIKSVLYGISAVPLSLYLPTLLASWYWTSHSRWQRMFLIVGCVLLFLAHPVGGQAWFYTLYWIIPFFIALFGCQTIFLKALGSTFTAHAVGSVLWLYITPLNPAAYVYLMPIVAVERFIFAVQMTLLYYSAIHIARYVQRTIRAQGSGKTRFAYYLIGE